MSTQLEPSSAHAAQRRKVVGDAAPTLLAMLILYACLQGIGLLLHIIGAARGGPGRTDGLETVGSVVSTVAWLVVLAGLVLLLIKVRASRARRAG
jgi:hypothetical protein